MKIQDLVVITNIEGKEKPKYTKIGILMTKDNNMKSIHLDVIPTGAWNGWASVFDQKNKEDKTAEGKSDNEPF
jgi:hypothetical protein